MFFWYIVYKTLFLERLYLFFRHFIPDFLALLVTSLAVSIVLEWLKKVTGYNRLIQNICMKIG